MPLPVKPPIAPMLAKLAHQLPAEGGYFFEPKWDGFRCLVFRDDDKLELTSRNQRSLTRYFPELIQPLGEALPPGTVVDGEIIIAGRHGLDFDALLQRIHPASSRVDSLAAATPASFVAFDLLGLSGRDLRQLPFSERRRSLEESLAPGVPQVLITPSTTDRNLAVDWFSRFEGAGLDGVMAKLATLPYRPGKRDMIKVKHERTADCVVAGFRWYRSEAVVGSLLLGLYDRTASLQHVGITASFTRQQREELVDQLSSHRLPEAADHPWLRRDGDDAATRRPGTANRWSGTRDLSFERLAPELVCEVAYDHLQGDRFRHPTTFRRWRPDRDPQSCTYDQLDVAVPAELATIFAGQTRRLTDNGPRRGPG